MRLGTTSALHLILNKKSHNEQLLKRGGYSIGTDVFLGERRYYWLCTRMYYYYK